MPEDRIHLRDLRLPCTVGVEDGEKRKKQDIVINVIIYADLKKAALSGRIKDTVDYRTIKEQIQTMVEESSFNLIESIAERIANLCLEDALVQKVQVSVDKPGALRITRSVAVEIERTR